MSSVESYNRFSLPVDGGIEHQLIRRIAQLGTPHEMTFNWLTHRNDRVDEDSNLCRVKTRGELMLRTSTRGFVFERQGHIRNQRQLSLPRGSQERGRRPCWTAQRRDDDVRVKYASH